MKSNQGEKTGLLAGFRFKAGCFRFGGDFCRLDMQELFHGTAGSLSVIGKYLT